VLEVLQTRMLPEFLNRIDEIIVFHTLGRDEIRQIVELQITRLVRQIDQQGLTLEVSETARDAIANEGYDPVYGARPLKRVIQQRIQNPLAVELLRGDFREGDTVQIDHRDGQFTFERR
ncbi:MAG: ATP-dependent chaperone ClpB, partial [Planctomycetaceae bacterium]|nr:ATP-dependent chaperone ClpB [Planctomycetaceae bacterium]